MCVSEPRLENKMWRVEGCTPESFSLLFVKKYSSSIIEYPIIKNNNYYNKSNEKLLFFVPRESLLLTMSVNRKVD